MGCNCNKSKPIVQNETALQNIKPSLAVNAEPSLAVNVDEKELVIHFDHGGGDCVHFAYLMQLYKRRGYKVKIFYEHNKEVIWKAAGLPFIGNGPYHRWEYHPGFNIPKPDEDWSGNKISLNMNKAPLPNIGPLPELWEELCSINLEGTLEPLLDDHTRKEAAEFVKDLPCPLILLHTHGTNMPFLKNIPNATVEELYRLLLKETDGGVVLCDWDERVPMLPHARIRHVKRDWGHISLLQFYALMKHASLLIGVDSCPYHFAAFTDVPTLGVFHHHYPSCVTLPRAKSLNMTRNAESYQPVNQARRARWNIIEYGGTFPTAQDITRHAKRILEGPRYGLPIGRDVMMQQWIRDWCLSSTSTSPVADRNITFDYLFREMTKRFECPTIVETGCIRSHEDWSAGNSTYLFSAWLDGRGLGKGRLISVDNDQGHCDFAAKAIKWNNAFTVVNSDSVKWLSEFNEQVDVLYLDSMDCENPSHADHGLEEIKAIVEKLPPQTLVVFDDTTWNRGWVGKGAKGVPFLLHRGWKILSSGYQVVLSRQY